MNILFINVMEGRHGSTHRARRLSWLLSKRHRVCYVESNHDKKDALPIHVVNGNRIISISQKNSVLGFITASWERGLLCWREDYDLLFLQKAWPLTLPCLIIAKLRRKKVIIDCDDLDSLWFCGILRRRLTSLTERWMPVWADLTTTHNQYLKEYIKRESGKDPLIVPQGVDTDLFDPNRFDPIVEKSSRGLQDKFVYAFLGSFTYGSARDLHVILKAMELIVQKQMNSVLLIIGGEGPLERKYCNIIADLGLNNHVIITGKLPQNHVPSYLAASDMGLIYMSDDLANKARVSFKLLEYLSMELQVVGHIVGESRDILGEYCFLCEPTIESMAQVAVEVSTRGLRKKSARGFLKKHYDWDVVGEALDRVVGSVQG